MIAFAWPAVALALGAGALWVLRSALASPKAVADLRHDLQDLAQKIHALEESKFPSESAAALFERCNKITADMLELKKLAQGLRSQEAVRTGIVRAGIAGAKFNSDEAP